MVSRANSKTPLLRRLSYPQVPLNEPIPQFVVPNNGPASDVSLERTTKVTQLSNGLKVASESDFGQFCTLGGEDLGLIVKINISRREYSLE